MTTATRPAGTGRRTSQVPRAGRPACTECGVRLSSYNPGPNCFAHTLDVPWKGPGVRPR